MEAEGGDEGAEEGREGSPTSGLGAASLHRSPSHSHVGPGVLVLPLSLPHPPLL